MKKIGLLFLLFLSTASVGIAQRAAIKTNILYAATTTPNLAVEAALSKHLTLDVVGGYNPWTFSGDRSFEHWMVQPELRYWIFEKFYGHFFGVHGQYIDYNIQYPNLPFDIMQNRRYDGTAVGGGLSYGYDWALSKHWNVEFTLGVGYMYFEYDKYAGDPQNEIPKGRFRTNYFGPTKAGISIVYIFK